MKMSQFVGGENMEDISMDGEQLLQVGEIAPVPPPDHAMDESEGDEEEREHWWQVMRHFLSYIDFFEADLDRRQRHLNKLNNIYMQRLPQSTFDKLTWLFDAAVLNQNFLDDMIHFHCRNSFLDPPKFAIEYADKNKEKGVDKDGAIVPLRDIGPKLSISQQHRNIATIHSLYREWSKEAVGERNECFSPILSQLEKHLPISSTDRENKVYRRVVVPGCGLGRLPVEIASRGYCCEGNEYSAYMAIASNFVLNGLQEKECYEISPWVNTICNVKKIDDTLKKVRIPDVSAVDLINPYENDDECPYPKFSMAAGNFVEIYGNPQNEGAWDCVVTCFFVDTAPVVIEYIDTINYILKPGGIWINLGPLLYHWVSDVDHNQDARYDESIELSYEEIKHVISTFGMEIIHEQFQDCTYTRCLESMMHTVYNTVLFTAKKPMTPQTK